MAAKSKPIPRGFWIILGSLALIALYMLGQNNERGAGDKAPFRNWIVGERGVIWRKGFSNYWIARDDAAWDAMISAQNRAAEGGPGALEPMAYLMSEGMVGMYPSGIPVVVTQTSFTALKVKMLSGPDSGKQGWIAREYVVREIPTEKPAPIEPPKAVPVLPGRTTDESLQLVLVCLGIAAAIMICVYVLGPKRSNAK